MVNSLDPGQRRLLSLLCHISALFSVLVVSIGVPIAIYLMTDDAVVKENARESLNLHLNIFALGIVFGILCIILVGFLLLWILGIIAVILPILAIIRTLADPNRPARYPLIFRLI